jgi:predicted HD phosphohydrolase
MTKEKLRELYDEVDIAMARLKAAQDTYLRAAGWTYSSNHPDACWRWSKSFNMRHYAFNAEDAIEFELRATA